MLGYNEKISIIISFDVKKDGNKYTLGVDKKMNVKETRDGKITVGEHKITIYEGSAREVTKNDSGVKDYAGLDLEDAIGAIAGHESGYTEKENTKQSYENSEKKGKHDVEKRPNEIESEILEELRKK